MEALLNDIEARIIGCLIEKELTTPEYYPLSLNSLTNACNQKSNRDPIMALAEEEVAKALESLRFKQLAVVSADGGRVRKHRHILAEKMGLVPGELAVICELLVRGPQTVGELRTRGERMHSFPDLGSVEVVLQELAERSHPLVTKLPRQPGRKESRFAHLFSGEPDTVTIAHEGEPEVVKLRGVAEIERIGRLEEEVAGLKEEVAELRKMVTEFKEQFD